MLRSTRRLQRAAVDLLELRGPIDQPITIINRRKRGSRFRVAIECDHLLGVLAAVEAGDLTAAEARTWATTLRPIYLQRVHQIADWPVSEDVQQTRNRLVLHHLAGVAPIWLGLDPYGTDAMRRVLTAQFWSETLQVLRETLIDPANPLTYAYEFAGSAFGVYPTGEDREFILAMHPAADTPGYAMPRKLAIATITEKGELGRIGRFKVNNGVCSFELIRSALEPHTQAIRHHLAETADR